MKIIQNITKSMIAQNVNASWNLYESGCGCGYGFGLLELPKAMLIGIELLWVITVPSKFK